MNATCNELALAGSVSLVSWIQPDQVTTATNIMRMRGTNTGYALYTTTNAEVGCSIGDNVGGDTQYEVSATSVLSVGVWAYASCVHSAAADTIAVYVNGAQSGAPSTTQQDMSAPTTNFQTSDGGADAYGGLMDEPAITSLVLTPGQLCHLASCGVNGTTGPCWCNGAAYADDGRLTTMSLGCSLAGVNCNDPIP